MDHDNQIIRVEHSPQMTFIAYGVLLLVSVVVVWVVGASNWVLQLVFGIECLAVFWVFLRERGEVLEFDTAQRRVAYHRLGLWGSHFGELRSEFAYSEISTVEIRHSRRYWSRLPDSYRVSIRLNTGAGLHLTRPLWSLVQANNTANWISRVLGITRPPTIEE